MSDAHEKYVALQHQRNAGAVSADLERSALLVIDMQEYFFNPGSPFNRLGEAQMPGVRTYFHERANEPVIPNIKKLLRFFRDRDAPVIFTTVASESADGRDLPPSWKAMNERAKEKVGDLWVPPRTDSWARIIDDLAPQPGDIVINKTTFSCFTSTGLDGSLRNMGIETLVISGVVTNRCVETTARDATDIGYQVVIVEDATATHSPEVQEATMLSLMGAYGHVRSTADTMKIYGS